MQKKSLQTNNQKLKKKAATYEFSTRRFDSKVNFVVD